MPTVAMAALENKYVKLVLIPPVSMQPLGFGQLC